MFDVKRHNDTKNIISNKQWHTVCLAGEKGYYRQTTTRITKFYVCVALKIAILNCSYLTQLKPVIQNEKYNKIFDQVNKKKRDNFEDCPHNISTR